MELLHGCQIHLRSLPLPLLLRIGLALKAHSELAERLPHHPAVLRGRVDVPLQHLLRHVFPPPLLLHGAS